MIVMPATFNAGDTVYFPFDTYDSTGASVTITGLAVTDIEVYKNGSTTQRASDNGYALLDTDGIDFDGATGLHGFSIDTSDNSDSGFWVDGAQYWVNVNAITVNAVTVRFTYYLTLGYLLRPTTAGRKLDVSSGGEAGIDLANVGSPTTTLNLSGTTVKTATDVEADTADIQSRLPAALDGDGNIKSSVYGFLGTGVSESNTGDVASAFAALFALDGTTPQATVATAVWAAGTRTLTAASDSAGVTTLLTRIGSALTITSGGVTLANGVAHGGATATLRLGGSTSTPALYVTNSGGDAAKLESTGGNGTGLALLGQGEGHGATMTGGAGGNGMGLRVVSQSTGGNGLYVYAPSEAVWLESLNSAALEFTTTDGTYAVFAQAPGNVIELHAGAGQHAIYATANGGADVGTVRANLTGDVGGKVLGTTAGGGTISGTGVRAVDSSGNAVAPAATALTATTWTDTRAGYLDNLSAGAVATAAALDAVDNFVDTEVAAIKAKTDNLPAAPAAVGDIPTAAANAAAVLAAAVESGLTVQQALRIVVAGLGGDVSTDGTVYYAPDGSTARLTVAASGDGRTVTRNL